MPVSAVCSEIEATTDSEVAAFGSDAGASPLEKADGFQLDQQGDREGVVDLRHIDIRRRHAGAREGRRRRRLAAEIGEARCGDDMLVGMALPRPQDLDRLVARSRGRSLAAHDHGRTAVGDQAAVQHAQRRGDFLGGQNVRYRDRRALLGLGVQQRMGAMLHRDRGKLFGGRAVFVHVAPRHQRIGGGNADAERPLELRVADFGKCCHGAIAREAAQAVVAGHDQHVLALAAGHQGGRLHDHDAGRRAACLDGQAGAGMDAQDLAEHRRQHQVRFGEGIGAQHAVDLADREPGVSQSAQGGFGMQAHAAAARKLAHGGVVGAGDEGVHRHGLMLPSNDRPRLARKSATARS